MPISGAQSFSLPIGQHLLTHRISARTSVALRSAACHRQLPRNPAPSASSSVPNLPDADSSIASDPNQSHTTSCQQAHVHPPRALKTADTTRRDRAAQSMTSSSHPQGDAMLPCSAATLPHSSPTPEKSPYHPTNIIRLAVLVAKGEPDPNLDLGMLPPAVVRFIPSNEPKRSH
jgi:hypothetical protein